MSAAALQDPVVLAFVVIPLLLVATFIGLVSAASKALNEPTAVRRRAVAVTTAGAAAWMLVTWIGGASGWVADWDATPPPFALLVVAIVALSVVVAAGSNGRRLATGVAVWGLVAFQSFRLPLEIAMHAMYERGVMPVQMSYSGRNFDIVTGVTAIVVAALLRRGVGGRPLALAWNILGFALLVNIMVVAILSTPRIRYFGDDALNVWVADPPFIWLPAVMVLAALAGHLVIFRALLWPRADAAAALPLDTAEGTPH